MTSYLSQVVSMLVSSRQSLEVSLSRLGLFDEGVTLCAKLKQLTLTFGQLGRLFLQLNTASSSSSSSSSSYLVA